MVREIRGNGAGLMAAAFVSIVPSYISRSVAGSYDLEAVAIFALMLVFYLYLKTLTTGSLLWATALSLAYFYMVLSWGGYSFIINLLPIHCLAAILTGRLTPRLYVAYAPLVVQGTLLAACIPVIGFNAVLMSEHFGAFLAFGVLHAALLLRFMEAHLSPRAFTTAKALAFTAGMALLGAATLGLLFYVIASPTFGWTGRSLSLLDPTYASKYIPIIASVSEHQPPAWNSYITDLHLLVLLAPAGIVAAFLPLTDASLFLVLYGITAVYFSGVMVRLMLVLAPAACCLGGLAAAQALETFATGLWKGGEEDEASAEARTTGKRADGGVGFWARPSRPLPFHGSVAGIALLLLGLMFYVVHCVWVSAEMYSAPSIVLQSRGRDGSLHVFDDFRAAYSWLEHNTPQDAIVASWWDYGYQTTAMANRTILVDNNTWNTTHIATVGRAMASPERKAWRIYRALDVSYVLVIFGGLVGYPSDDINKFLWMVRIAGGVYPEVKERDYVGPQGYRVDEHVTKAMADSLMYRLTYYGFQEGSRQRTGVEGYDRVRNCKIGKMDIKLKYFEEVFTTEHWMVRIYRVLDQPNRDPRLPNPLRPSGKASRSKRKAIDPSGRAVRDKAASRT